MTTKIWLNDEEKASLEKYIGQKVDYLVIKGVTLSLTDKQRRQIREATGQNVKELELTEYDLEKLSSRPEMRTLGVEPEGL